MPHRSLPLRTTATTTRIEICQWTCGAKCFRTPPNCSGNEPFTGVVARVMSRRKVLTGGLAVAVVLSSAGMAGCARSQPRAEGSLTFPPIEPNVDDDVVVPDGYGWDVFIRWGDPLTTNAGEFDFANQSPEAQAQQFGYNCDFLAFLPGNGGDVDLLWVNHETPSATLMLPDRDAAHPTERQVNIELAAIGGSVVAIRHTGENRYQYVRGHRLNRRITGETPMLLTGPAAGSSLLRTSEDPTGTRVRGTLHNCAGGVTPWGTVLTCEETFSVFFGNLAGVTDQRIRALHERFMSETGPSKRLWERHHPRFDLGREPHEPFRFGWVVEVNPFEPSSTPRKRTAMGRFEHEGATPAITRDGRVAVYMGDDEAFEYVYKFITAGRVDNADSDLLDDGTLYVAHFDVNQAGNGIGQWLPLVHGERGLTEEHGFASQADVLINTRGAADVVGATPMDRPEDIEISPVTGAVYLVMTQNPERSAKAGPGTSPANPRSFNTAGHVIELVEDGDDAAATTFTWRIFLLCGNPDDPSTFFAGFPKNQVSPIATPDNLTFDRQGHLWLATDGQSDALGFNDALYAVPVTGRDRGHVRMFASVPRGAEATGPVFSPDGRTLFASVQHPGQDGTLRNPSSDWPDRVQPPRPSVIMLYKTSGDPRIGS
jgi:uncharacterized protein